jgi:hypothetical protein
MKDVLTAEEAGYWDRGKEEKFSISHATFPSVHEQNSTLYNQTVLHDIAHVVLHYSIFLVYQLDRTLGREKNFLKFLGRCRYVPLVQELLNKSDHWHG